MRDRRILLAALGWMFASSAGWGKDDVSLVDASAAIPDLIVDLRYATADNFLKRPLYPAGARCLLLRSTVERLVHAAELLRAKGFRVKVYDCYRPLSVQWEMWKVMPQPGYVADPRKGSNHNRGAAVDLTLSTSTGAEVEMPTPFDTFGPAAHHDYAHVSAAARKNREALRQAMETAGFKPNRMEWWHYDLPGAEQRPVLDLPLGAPPAASADAGR
jgi:D-alanyl-D-alanine dipeptidase